MRRALSILMVVVFWMPSLVLLSGAAAEDDASLPACCRMHGQHHCIMSEAQRATLQAMGVAAPEFRAPVQKCPFQQQAVRGVHEARFAMPGGQAVYAAVVSHPTGLAQTQSKWRVSRERARQKRGPPMGLLS